MTDLRLTLACGAYDRTAALQDGTVRPRGIDLSFLPMYPGELFRRQGRDAEFDVAEFSYATYCLLRGRLDERMTAIPVFPSRKFRHSHIFVNPEVVSRPEDLRGKRVGVSDFQQTAGVWLRGMLGDEYGVRPEEVEWVVAGLNEPSTHGDRVPIELPDRMRVVRAGPQQFLDQMIVDGEIDAIIDPQIPASLRRPDTPVTRLFADPIAVEKDYYRRTGLFPIMHVVVIRADILERHPWVARNLYDAFEEAKRVGRERLRFPGTLYCSLPWLTRHLEEVDELTGGADLFAYGMSANRRGLELIPRYCEEQGLLGSALDLDDIFLLGDT